MQKQGCGCCVGCGCVVNFGTGDVGEMEKERGDNNSTETQAKSQSEGTLPHRTLGADLIAGQGKEVNTEKRNENDPHTIDEPPP